MSTNTITAMAYPIGENELQTRRLMTQAQLYDPFTRAFFRAAGIGPGMRVLELGSGVGDVTLLVAELVGPSGHITGIELKSAAADTARARVQAVGWQNVDIVAGDLASIQLDQEFDAIVGRFILMWLPHPRDILARVLQYLRPGGVVAFQDNDFTFGVMTSSPLPLIETIGKLMTQTQSQPGPDFHMGLKLHRLYQEVGLVPPQLTLQAPLGTGREWTGYEFIAETMAMLKPRMEQLGIAIPDELTDAASLAERIRDEAVENNAVIVLPACVGAWSRKQPQH